MLPKKAQILPQCFTVSSQPLCCCHAATTHLICFKHLCFSFVLTGLLQTTIRLLFLTSSLKFQWYIYWHFYYYVSEFTRAYTWLYYASCVFIRKCRCMSSQFIYLWLYCLSSIVPKWTFWCCNLLLANFSFANFVSYTCNAGVWQYVFHHRWWCFGQPSGISCYLGIRFK